MKSILRPDDDPNLHGEHHGSAYQGGWYGYAQKDLRRVLRRRRARQALARLLRRHAEAPGHAPKVPVAAAGFA